jgi:hypothetical protein
MASRYIVQPNVDEETTMAKMLVMSATKPWLSPPVANFYSAARTFGRFKRNALLRSSTGFKD